MKIGTYSIPNNPYRLPRLVEITKIIYDTFEDKLIPKAYANDALAKLLKHKTSNNSGFWMELAALKAYGLLEAINRSDMRVTNIGKDITYGTEEQINQAALKAVLNIPLWKPLYERYRCQLPSQDFWAKLQAITGIDAKVARSNEQYITDAFRLDTSLIKGINPPSPEVKNLTETMENIPTRSAKDSFPEVPSDVVSYGSSEDYSIWVKKDPEAIEFVESQIEAIKAWLKHQKTKLATEKTS